jgi:hypothetical protein
VNESGASYPNARLKLVAGDVRRLRREQPPQPLFQDRGGAAGSGFREKGLFEYHLYTLDRPTSVANNSTKQIELFPRKSELPCSKLYVFEGAPADFPMGNDAAADLRERSNAKVDVYLQLNNSQKGGLGVPLPAGRIRVYKRDDAGPDQAGDELEFIGEDKIDHTPKDEKILVRVGSAFDVTGQWRQTNVTRAQRTATDSVEVKLRNHKDQPAHVIVKENLRRGGEWEITASSDKFEKRDSHTIHIPVDVPAGGEKTVTYTVKYTW